MRSTITFPATTAIAEAARRRLLQRTPHRIEIDADFLDLARITDPGHEGRMASFLRDKYAHNPPHVVMTLGSAALPFVIAHRDVVAPGVPIVFTSISPQTFSAMSPGAGVTGIITEFNLDKTLALAERLQPDARRLFVVAGSGATDRRWQPVARKVVEARERTFEMRNLLTSRGRLGFRRHLGRDVDEYSTGPGRGRRGRRRPTVPECEPNAPRRSAGRHERPVPPVSPQSRRPGTLTAILSNAQAALHLLAHRSPDLAEVRDALQDIIDEDNHAAEVVHRLRTLLEEGRA